MALLAAELSPALMASRTARISVCRSAETSCPGGEFVVLEFELPAEPVLAKDAAFNAVELSGACLPVPIADRCCPGLCQSD